MKLDSGEKLHKYMCVLVCVHVKEEKKMSIGSC